MKEGERAVLGIAAYGNVCLIVGKKDKVTDIIETMEKFYAIKKSGAAKKSLGHEIE